MAKAFLSHSSKQKDLVKNIAEKLGRDNCVLDEFHFNAGGRTIEEIYRTMDDSDLFVLFLSKEAITSEWVKQEIAHHTTLQGLNSQSRILIFLVDNELTHKDMDIPEWMRQNFNLKPVVDPILIYKRIDAKLRDINLEKYPSIKKKEEIFVGRNQLMESFESRYYTFDNSKPSVIIVSGLEEVGRRKFIINALDKAKRINKFHHQISVLIDSRDSIEDFILRIEDLNSIPSKELIEHIRSLDMVGKIEYAKKLLLKFKENNEILFVIDNSGIIQPTKKIADWFEKIFENDDFKNVTVCCLISKMRLTKTPPDIKKFLSFHVSELTGIDTQILFLKYCNEIFHLELDAEKAYTIVNSLNGMPGQVFHAVSLIDTLGLDLTIKNLDEIKKYNDVRVFTIIEEIKKDGQIFFDILVLICKVEFISFEIIYKIFGRTDEVEEILEKLFCCGVYDYMGIEKEYIQAHFAIVDYVQRSKYKMSEESRTKLRKELNNILNDDYDYPDVSQLLLTVKSLVEEDLKVPDRYLLPSFLLRTIIDSYYAGKYSNVENYALKILDNTSRYDASIVREIRYWYTQALARKISKNGSLNYDKFYAQLNHFNGADYYFLLGFFQRLTGKMEDAESSFLHAINLGDDAQKARRELVQVRLNLEKYDKALELAKENYQRKRLNTFHIHAYFMCLTRKSSLKPEEKMIIKELFQSIKISHDPRAAEIEAMMTAEYKYYVDKDPEAAIRELNQLIETAVYKWAPKKALLRIYNKQGFKAAEEKLRKEFIDKNEEEIL